MAPELKKPSVPMRYEIDYTQQDDAQQMIEEYGDAGVAPSDVWAQSFNLDDMRYWITNEPDFGEQAVYLGDRYEDTTFDHTDPSTYDVSMAQLAADPGQPGPANTVPFFYDPSRLPNALSIRNRFEGPPLSLESGLHPVPGYHRSTGQPAILFPLGLAGQSWPSS